MHAALNLRTAARALGGEISGRDHVRCPGPGHSRVDRSLVVHFTSDGFLVHSFAGDDWKACRAHVAELLGLDDGPRTAGVTNTAPAADTCHLIDMRRRIERAAAIWSASLPLPGTTAETYLKSRGLAYEGEALRFHPRCPLGREWHPAMVGLMTDVVTGEPCGVHRTALLPGGSGKASPGKQMLGRASGAVVRLSPDEDV